MEDRHSVSEPRPVDGGVGKPSWEVDILRDDTLVVDTFSLSNDNLPPRTNKKGKVVWRLPDKADKLVSCKRNGHAYTLCISLILTTSFANRTRAHLMGMISTIALVRNRRSASHSEPLQGSKEEAEAGEEETKPLSI